NFIMSEIKSMVENINEMIERGNINSSLFELIKKLREDGVTLNVSCLGNLSKPIESDIRNILLPKTQFDTIESKKSEESNISEPDLTFIQTPPQIPPKENYRVKNMPHFQSQNDKTKILLNKM